MKTPRTVLVDPRSCACGAVLLDGRFDLVFRAPSGEERIVLDEPVLLCRTCPTILMDPPRVGGLGVAGWKLVSVVATDRWYRDGR